MLETSNTVVPSQAQWLAIIAGMRNPMNSWKLSDTDMVFQDEAFEIGPRDLDLMIRLASGGQPNRKFLRMIPVFVDVTAPLYWWKEFETYKIGTVCNSCSTMHKITSKKFDINDFSYEYLDSQSIDILNLVIEHLNNCRDQFLTYDSSDSEKIIKKHIWYQLIQLLPSSYNQKRTIMLNYEVLRQIYIWRRNHKLDEWRQFCKWISSLPYAKDLIMEDNKHG